MKSTISRVTSIEIGTKFMSAMNQTPVEIRIATGRLFSFTSPSGYRYQRSGPYA